MELFRFFIALLKFSFDSPSHIHKTPKYRSNTSQHSSLFSHLPDVVWVPVSAEAVKACQIRAGQRWHVPSPTVPSLAWARSESAATSVPSQTSVTTRWPHLLSATLNTVRRVKENEPYEWPTGCSQCQLFAVPCSLYSTNIKLTNNLSVLCPCIPNVHTL
jgi:hypothetical protein